MYFIEKYFGKNPRKKKEDVINENDIEIFIDRNIEESVNLDYKDIEKYHDKEGLGKVISSFANTYGGLIAAEMPMYSPTLFYRGLIDCFFQDRVYGPVVTDFKTSNGYIKKGSVKELKYK